MAHIQTYRRPCKVYNNGENSIHFLMPKNPGPQIWQANFLDRSPMMAPLQLVGAHLCGAAWPSLEALQPPIPITTVSGKTLRFVPQGAKPACFEEQYEPRIHLRDEVQTRTGNWHDLFNALAWPAFLRAKATITDQHYQAAITQLAGQNRHPDRHALTLFDESGVAVACADPELVAVLEALGATAVKTYIQCGNAVFRCAECNPDEIA